VKKPGITAAVLVFALVCLGCLGCCAAKNIWPESATNRGHEADFAAFKAKKLALPAGHEPVCLVAVGDIMLSRGVAAASERHGDWGHPLAKVKDILREGDLVFGNLENPVTPGRKISLPEMVLRAGPGTVPALKDAGFNLLSLANNHAMDFGRRGLLDTLQYLDQAGINYAGAGKTQAEAGSAKFLKVKGLKLAFLAFCDPVLAPASYRAPEPDAPGVAFREPEKIKTAVKNAAEKSDFVVVSLHAGAEYRPEPGHIQVQYARSAIDAGADLVLGHHPHVVQKVEKYRGKYIFYSLGNFIFDQMWSRPTREGLVARFFINQSGITQIEFLPVYINDDCQPQALSGWEAAKVLAKLGLELNEETLPVWNRQEKTFRESKRYTVYPGPEFKLVKSRCYDLDRDGRDENYSLRDGTLKVETGSGSSAGTAAETLWQSPEDWWVDDFFLGDSDNNGREELNLLVWKKGSFGPHKPFWMTREDRSVKNHLFIFQPAGGTFKPVWQSSNLDRPNYRTVLKDIDGDGANELLVTEGDYDNPAYRQVSVWKWNGWGFTNISG